MNTDIRIKVGQPYHRKTKKLIRLAGPEAYLCLVKLWVQIALNHPRGDYVMTAEDLEVDGEWAGEKGQFAKALVAVGYMDKSGKGYIAHDWVEHQGWAVGADERSENASKAAKAMWEKRRSADRNANSKRGASEQQADSYAPILSSPNLTLPKEEKTVPVSTKNELSEIITQPETPYAVCETIKSEIDRLCGKPTILNLKPSLRPIKDLLTQGIGFEQIVKVYRSVFDPSLDGDRNALWHRGKLTNATFGNHLLNNWGDLQAIQAPRISSKAAKLEAFNREMEVKHHTKS